MRCTKLVLALTSTMVVLMMVSAPAMAQDFNHPFFFDHNNPFQSLDQQANSGDINQSFDVSQTGDNSNQCVGITGNANTGNTQNQIGVIPFGNFGAFNPFFNDFGFLNNGFDNGFGFGNAGAALDVSGSSNTNCDQQVNQAAAAG